MENFEFVVDRSNRLLRIVMRGAWTTATVGRYRDAVQTVRNRMIANGCPPGESVVLVDARDLPVQPQDVAEEYRLTFAEGPMPHKLATLVSTSLFKLQAKRIGFENQRIFADEDEALKWLLARED